jgi:hypothetical protein
MILLLKGFLMNFTTSVQTCLHQYATFSGRASRSQYFYFSLFNLIALISLVLFGVCFGTLLWGADHSFVVEGFALGSGLLLSAFLSALFALLMALPNWAVSVRRLHDSDKSGWWLLLGLLPYVGSLIVLVLLLLPSTNGPNRYGQAEGA